MNELMKTSQILQQAAISAITTVALFALWQLLPIPTRFGYLSSDLIELEGASGRAVLSSMDPLGTTGLVIEGPGGKGMVTIDVSANGTPSISMMSADGTSSLSVMLPPDGVPVISSPKPPKLRGWE
jgi:hypothetical protein